MKIGIGLMALVLASQEASSAAAAGFVRRMHAARADHPERGDVPGWVMITLMSAVLVAGLLAIAGPALETMFNDAMGKIGK
ncbi:hypothetical protein V1639_06300 [Pseudarthrobacter sp. J75]|uniref:hypothetical protein n=1 Tax=unclassified Pseudarthrobacter TaxID=2647000 RepID=UPI002E80355D|nr:MULTISPECIES: hypothetical protein [unclassified Pseudarthrobacter]MEE2521409.1 hypothetical protein [Pseudarthrobacter sp. J47]MEE2528641.1 hypothetical protein [Pseudarthrobacter sp. J75]MEE2568332.1 hypothetical protein [Pseudarthrobacter sp. J64]